MAEQYVEQLAAARERVVADRRELAEELAKPYERGRYGNGVGSSKSRPPSMRLTAPSKTSGASQKRGSLCLLWLQLS